MMGVNRVTLLGNLGADPETKKTAGGQTITLFNLATSNAWTNREGQRQEHTEWHRIVAWGKLAETCAEYLTKGRKVYIEGRIQTRSWEDDKGQKRYTTEVVASQVLFLGGNQDRKSSSDYHSSSSSYQNEPHFSSSSSSSGSNNAKEGAAGQGAKHNEKSRSNEDNMPF